MLYTDVALQDALGWEILALKNMLLVVHNNEIETGKKKKIYIYILNSMRVNFQQCVLAMKIKLN